MVHALAKRDERVLYIGSDPGSGTPDAMAKEFPDRVFIEGISEAHVVGMSAGLAMEGYIPYVNTIATFLTRRCYEQVAVDVCLHELPLRLIANGGGVVYAPLGPTHTAVEDIAIMRALPNMTIVCPTDGDEMRRFMEQTTEWPKPIYIRLGKGGDPITSRAEEGFTIGKAIVKRRSRPRAAGDHRIMVYHVLGATKLLAERGIACGVVHFPTVKPLDTATLLDLGERRRRRRHRRGAHAHRRSGDAVLKACPTAACSTSRFWARSARPLHAQLRLTGRAHQALRSQRRRHCRRSREIHGPPEDRATGFTDERMRGPCSKFATPTCRSSSPTRAKSSRSCGASCRPATSPWASP
jgi:transketolase